MQPLKMFTLFAISMILSSIASAAAVNMTPKKAEIIKTKASDLAAIVYANQPELVGTEARPAVKSYKCKVEGNWLYGSFFPASITPVKVDAASLSDAAELVMTQYKPIEPVKPNRPIKVMIDGSPFMIEFVKCTGEGEEI